ncbi:MAG: Hpt domain-containing protein [Gammaproteobacteria bacterium]|nr:Hpt domain-containing protein [Gammaproteobacteria bacterium]
MSDHCPDTPYRLEALKSNYRRSLGAKLQELEVRWEQCRQSRYANDRLANLSVWAHRIAGSAGSYGYTELSAAALTLDRCLQGWTQDRLDPDRLEQLHILYQQLYDVLAQAACNADPST